MNDFESSEFESNNFESNDFKSRSALIAGEGVLPVEIARRLAARGEAPFVLALRSGGDAFAGIAGEVMRVRRPSISRVIGEIRRRGIRSVIMAGHVPKKLIYLPSLLTDPLALKILARSALDDHGLLASIVQAFEKEGIAVLPYWQILPEFMAPCGEMGHRPPTADEARDFEYGASVLKVTLPCSFGQALVVARGAVVAVEAMEGTDALIGRAGKLAAGGVLVKMMRVDQDTRYDLPTVGPGTVENMARSGLTCLAVESRRTIILEPDKFFDLARRKNIALWGLPCQSS